MEHRQRASAACELCRRSKLKCDITRSGPPCTRCRSRGEGDTNACRLLQSKRGQNPRRRKRKSLAESPSTTSQVASVVTTSANGIQRNDPGVPPTSDSIVAVDDSLQDATNARQSVSWRSAFEALLRSAGDRVTSRSASLALDVASFPLAAVFCQDNNDITLQSGQAEDSAENEQDSWNRLRQAIPEAERAFLEAKGCLRPPSKACQDTLFPIFLQKFLPLYPIIDREVFVSKRRQGTLALIFQHAVCGAAISFCSLASLTPLGFSSRRDAWESFFGKAKCLFDFRYERQRITLLQTCVCLSFWPSNGPADVFNTFQWIGFGVTLAESAGTHKSFQRSSLQPDTKRALRKIWRVLFFRDTFGAALFGRPLRINETQCDTESLIGGDVDCGVSDFTDFSTDDRHKSLFTELYLDFATSLAVLFRSIYRLRTEQSRAEHDYSNDRAFYHEALSRWESDLPPELAFTGDSKALSLPAKVLSMLFHMAKLLLSIPKNETGWHSSQEQGNTTSTPIYAPDPDVHSKSSECILKTIVSIVSSDELTSVPHECFISVFLAAVSTMQNERCAPPELIDSRMENFQMIFHQLKEYWEPASWMMHLFANLPIPRSPAQRELASPTEQVTSASPNQSAGEHAREPFDLDFSWLTDDFFATYLEQ
jgi:alkylhydroperoxidase family enzyme